MTQIDKDGEARSQLGFLLSNLIRAFIFQFWRGELKRGRRARKARQIKEKRRQVVGAGRKARKVDDERFFAAVANEALAKRIVAADINHVSCCGFEPRRSFLSTSSGVGGALRKGC
jgi:hypothetical protein